MFKHTKIGATIGPACQDMETLVAMVKSGMNFARLNFSHGTYEDHTKLIENIRSVEKKTGEPIAIFQDLQGPKMRLGVLPKEGVSITVGEMVTFDTHATEYQEKILPITYPGLEEFLKLGERLLIDDGHFEVVVKEKKGSKIIAEVVEGGVLSSHKGFNFPDSTLLSIPALSQKDKDDVKFGVKMGVDIISLSFVKRAQDILDLRSLIEAYEKELGIHPEQPIRLVAKIERYEAVENIKEILDVADGIMVARGDLGLEMAAAKVPLAQKMIIEEANNMAKPVIVATQMLFSMQTNRRPTRAEVSDVANAVIDHADALLLSNETASGKHPALAIQTMTDVILATERSEYDDMNLPAVRKKGTSVDVAITEVSRFLSDQIDAKLILAASLTGETGRMISHVRPDLPIFVATTSERVWRQLNLTWGVRSFILPPCRTLKELVDRSIQYLNQAAIVKNGDKIIIVAGDPVGQAGHVNLVEVREIE